MTSVSPVRKAGRLGEKENWMEEEALRQWAEFRNVRVAALIEANPGLNQITAMIMAGDQISAEAATAAVKSGADPRSVLSQIGSYSRFGWAYENLRREDLLAMLPELWRGADPDDTDPRFLALWKEARAAKGFVITDGKRLPLKPVWITVYRGEEQVVAKPTGCAFTLDKEIALAFAAGRGSRRGDAGGVVLKGIARRSAVMAYITQRHEEELIVDPADVEGVTTYATEVTHKAPR